MLLLIHKIGLGGEAPKFYKIFLKIKRVSTESS